MSIARLCPIFAGMRPLAWFIACFFLLLSGCAIMGDAPLGGDKDVTPPKAVSQEPENKSVNFSDSRILLNFDENVELSNPQSEIIFTPQVEGNPTYTTKGRSIIINLKDVKLAPNTTYTILTGNAIRDVHEGNILGGYSYVFSTGSYLDSLVLRGQVVDALTGSPVIGALAMLYKPGNDSAIYTSKPMYYAKADSSGKFRIENLPKTNFRLYVLGDKNANLTLDEGEAAGLYPEIVSLDSNITLPEPVKTFTEPKRQVIIKRINAFQDQISVKLGTPADSFTLIGQKYYRKYNLNVDSAVFWPAQSFSLPFTLSVYKSGQRLDSTFNFQSKNVIPSKVPLSYWGADQAANAYGMPFVVETAAPVSSIDSTKISIYDNGKKRPFSSIHFLTADHTLIGFNYNYQEDSSYKITILPGALKTNAGTNDTFHADVTMPDSRNFAYLQLRVELPDTGRSWILQLVRDNGDVVISRQLDSSSVVTWPFLPGGNYRLRVIQDTNGNGRFDAGNLVRNSLPERVIYYPQPIVLKPNWEMADVVFHVEK